MRGLFALALCFGLGAVALAEHASYGVCAHLAGGEYKKLDETCEMIALTGIGYVRADFNWNHCQRKPGGEWNFSQFDRVGFRNMEGRVIAPRKLGPRTWLVPFSGSPIYFIGGQIGK